MITQSHEQNTLFFTKFPFLGELKGTVSRDFRHYLNKKNSTCAPYKHVKTVLRNVSFSQRYLRKTCV